VPALPAGVAYVDVAAGAFHSLARLSDGSIVAWGANDQGQRNVPALPTGTVYEDVAAGGNHSLARRSDGEVVSWGSDSGNPLEVPAAPGFDFVELSGAFYRSLARLEGACPPPAKYCTAKTNSLGCTPSIVMVGVPSASSGQACLLRTTGVIGGMVGINFHSTVGAQAQPFHGGFLCVAPPLLRHALAFSGGGATPCDGIFTEDFNAYIAAGNDPALAAGASVWLQHWSRDPAAPFGDSLSDALAAVICP
jgi:hypothetical protein